MAVVGRMINTAIIGPTVLPQEEKGGLIDQLRRVEQSLIREIQKNRDQINGFISTGAPGSTDAEIQNIEGVWVTVTATAEGVQTFTHNMDLPVETHVGSNHTVTRPNVRWTNVCFSHGDRDGGDSQTGAPGDTDNYSLVFRHGDTVAANSIPLYFGCDKVVDATNEVTIDVFFIPAET